VFGDAWAKGIRDFDAKGAYTVLRAAAMGPLPKDGRDNIKEYVEHGFVPMDLAGDGGSKTLEYAYDDFALSVLAEGLGEKADAELFRKRAGNWKNIYDEQTGFIMGKKLDGTFPRDDDKTAWQDYWAEGTTWHYTWFVPQDMPGLATAMGGRDKFLARLDDYFAMSTCQNPTRLAPKPYYWHSNEPVLFIPWAYAELDAGKRGAQWIRWALANEYGDGPDGLPGNDDGGTMSAWYLFAGMGIFPRVAFTDYLVGSPIFPKATLKVANGTLTIVANGTSSTKFFPKSVTWNGKPVEKSRVEHADLIKGGTLEFTLE
jgi:predicted alpha-1,2-mannosidase